MSDLDLLVNAAKAAGLKHVNYTGFEYSGSLGLQLVDEVGRHTITWAPLSNDGDALRLSIKLKLDINYGNELDNDDYVSVSRHGIEMVRDPVSVYEYAGGELSRPYAVRRAIVRCAAEIGKLIS